MEVRLETAEDIEHIPTVLNDAFGDRREIIQMIDDLRREGNFSRHTSLVAIKDGKVVGYALFIDIMLKDFTGRNIKTANLTPLGILTAYQGRGIGRALIERGLEELRRRGYEAVLLIGSPVLYGKFGFSSKLTQNITGAYSDKGKAFQGLELREGALEFDSAFITLASAVIRMDQASAKSKKGKAPQP